MSVEASPENLANLGLALRKRAVMQRHRSLLVVAGQSQWCQKTAAALLSKLDISDSLWVANRPVPDCRVIDNSCYEKLLGSEVDMLIYNAHDGFDANAFGSLSGSIRGGGAMILLVPPLAQWPSSPDAEHVRFVEGEIQHSHFIQRIADSILSSDKALVVTEGLPLPSLPTDEIVTAVVDDMPLPCLTVDQQDAVAAIIKVVKGHRRRPLVMVSDRGRGKSSALGIAAAQLINQGLKRIAVTAPGLASVAPVFERAAALLGGAEIGNGRICLADAVIEFIAPDSLVLDEHEFDLLLVDEAAAIPVPMLELMLGRYSRIVFTTTVHGYEGTGRGFALRFNKVLDDKTPGWKKIRLLAPIRWTVNDPLEQFVFDALLLDATLAEESSVASASLEECNFGMLRQSDLSEDEPLLRQVFGLLVLAHYRTRPNDLRQLLDNPALSVCLASYAGKVVGVVLLSEEGGLDDEVAQAVYEGRRRLRGHLLPQSLANHIGLVEAASLNYWRVVRIAVHPSAQRRGIGAGMLAHIKAQSELKLHDCLGASFGGNRDLLGFWYKAGYVPVRVGLTREHTSGEHSVLMLQGISKPGCELLDEAVLRFIDGLPHLLLEQLQDLDPDVVVLLFKQVQVIFSNTIDSDDWRDLETFAFAQRTYESVVAQLWGLVLHWASDFDNDVLLNEQERRLLVVRVLQKRSWAETGKLLGLSGKREVQDLLRVAIGKLVHCYSDII